MDIFKDPRLTVDFIVSVLIIIIQQYMSITGRQVVIPKCTTSVATGS